MILEAMKHYKLIVHLDANSVKDYPKVKDFAETILEAQTDPAIWIDSVKIIDIDKEREETLK